MPKLAKSSLRAPDCGVEIHVSGRYLTPVTHPVGQIHCGSSNRRIVTTTPPQTPVLSRSTHVFRDAVTLIKLNADAMNLNPSETRRVLSRWG